MKYSVFDISYLAKEPLNTLNRFFHKELTSKEHQKTDSHKNKNLTGSTHNFVPYPTEKKINKLKKTYKLNSTTYNVPLSPSLKLSSFLNPIHSNTSMHILHTVLCTSPKVLTKRICLRIQNFLRW